MLPLVNHLALVLLRLLDMRPKRSCPGWHGFRLQWPGHISVFRSAWAFLGKVDSRAGPFFALWIMEQMRLWGAALVARRERGPKDSVH